MFYITSYYSSELGKTTISLSGPKNGQNRYAVKEDLDEIRNEINLVCPKSKRMVKGEDSLTITYFPHMEIRPMMVVDNIQF